MVGGGAYVLAAAAGPRLPQRREIQTRQRKRRLQRRAVWGRHGTPRARGEEGGGVWRVAGRGGAEEAEGAGGPQGLKRHAGFGDARREGAGMEGGRPRGHGLRAA